ncbi:type VI secretion system ImpA domain-containing protein [Pandoraea pulmonicola]|uniref:Type VI secretion system ImpA domain-containing protein n=1 Tax=Pandoraea pulmonicola TaxID=93221 RepID=A0ABM5S3P2_PANPU|nr:type VI secretion system ImpA domain-containing protein [Pandoraea pulmonicola]
MRAGEAFALLQAEIDKLTDIHASAAIEWPSVVSHAQSILREDGKDLAVTVWLVIGWLQLDGLAGLARGVCVLRDLLTLHWDTLFPPIDRLRGRRNLVEWLLTKLEQELADDRPPKLTPLPPPELADMVSKWNDIERCWRQHDPDGPEFSRVSRLFTSLPTTLACAPVDPEHTATENDGLAALAPGLSEVEPLEQSAERALRALGALLDRCFNEQPFEPFAYRLNAMAAWALVDAAPYATNDVTHVPPPPDVVKKALAEFAEGADPFAAARFAQTQLTSAPFWLDLCRVTHHALQRAGAAAAAQEVAAQTSCFAGRLPSLPSLKFSDGTPFADAATVDWLAAIAPRSPQNESQDSAPDDWACALHEMRACAAAGRLDDALEALDKRRSCAVAERDQFRAHLAQCELIRDFGGAGVGFALAALSAPLVEHIETHRLMQWEPALARDALALAAAAAEQEEFGHHERSDLLARLAALDFSMAWRLVRTRKPDVVNWTGA